MKRKILLICGIVSSLVYVAMNVFVPMQWEGYSSASQTVSELSAIGAPTRPLWVPLGVAYTCLWPPSGGASGGAARKVDQYAARKADHSRAVHSTFF